jgi:tetratricopeptide (TPR) repeat protein
LRDKAATGAFTEADLRATRPLVALAEPDDAERDRKLREVIAETDEQAVSTEARLETVLQESPVHAAASTKPRNAPRGQARSGDGGAAAEREPAPKKADPKAAPTPAAAPGDDGDAGRGGPGKNDARALARRGEEALASADRTAAERLFHQALSRDSRNAAALSGLSSIHYDRGAYGKAVSYAQKAVGAAPSSAKYRLQLGDAYFKSFKYAQARAQYEKARSLGNPAAAARLAKVAEKMGG